MTIFAGYTYDTTHRGLGGALRLVWFTVLFWLRKLFSAASCHSTNPVSGDRGRSYGCEQRRVISAPPMVSK